MANRPDFISAVRCQTAAATAANTNLQSPTQAVELFAPDATNGSRVNAVSVADCSQDIEGASPHSSGDTVARQAQLFIKEGSNYRLIRPYLIPAVANGIVAEAAGSTQQPGHLGVIPMDLVLRPTETLYAAVSTANAAHFCAFGGDLGGTNEIYPVTPRCEVKELTSSEVDLTGGGSNYTTIFSAGSSGSRVDRVIASSTATSGWGVGTVAVSGRLVNFFINDGVNRRYLTSRALEYASDVATSAAPDSVTVELGIVLESGQSLEASVYGAHKTHIVASGGDYSGTYPIFATTQLMANVVIPNGSVANHEYLDGDSSGQYQSLVSAGSSGSRIDRVITTDVDNALAGGATTARLVSFYLYDGSSSRYLAHVEEIPSVAATHDTISTRKVWEPKINLASGWSLLAAVTHNAETHIRVEGGSY